VGHEERFPSTRLNAGCGFRKETIAGMRRNGQDAPKPAVRRLANRIHWMRRPAQHSHPCIEALGSGKARHKPDQIATIVQPNIGNFVRTLAMSKTAPLRDFPAGRGRGVAADVRGYPDAPHRPGCGRHPRHHDEGRGQMRQPTVQLRLCGGTVTTFSTTRRPAISSRTVSRTPCGLGHPTAADDRAYNKSGEYRRIRGRTYCPDGTIGASIWGISKQNL